MKIVRDEDGGPAQRQELTEGQLQCADALWDRVGCVADLDLSYDDWMRCFHRADDVDRELTRWRLVAEVSDHLWQAPPGHHLTLPAMVQLVADALDQIDGKGAESAQAREACQVKSRILSKHFGVLSEHFGVDDELNGVDSESRPVRLNRAEARLIVRHWLERTRDSDSRPWSGPFSPDMLVLMSGADQIANLMEVGLVSRAEVAAMEVEVATQDGGPAPCDLLYELDPEDGEAP